MVLTISHCIEMRFRLQPFGQQIFKQKLLCLESNFYL